MLCSLLTVLMLGGCSRGPDVDDGHALASVPGEVAVDLAALDDAELLELALSEATDEHGDPALRAAILSHLRAGGQARLDSLIAAYHSPDRPKADDEAWRTLIDEVAGQRDAHYGGLFWHTDMQAALAQAQATGKPVLSLRMLGELTSEYSCANSRLFRTLLYADPELAGWLKDNFVLHWSSERPVPRVAIDFGDGRVVERTITGNSAHFVLDSQGRTIDVIPGLWTATHFRAALGESLALYGKLERTRHERQWRGVLAAHHDAAFAAAVVRMSDELTWMRGIKQDPRAVQMWLSGRSEAETRVAAMQAVPLAISKAKIEQPILAAAPDSLGGGAAGAMPEGIGSYDDIDRLAVGTHMTPGAALHPNSLAIIAAERPLDGLVPADQLPEANQVMLDTLLASLRQDTAKNALELHPRVHIELAKRARDRGSLGFAEVDAWVYASLFETPATDPWLGLVDASVYTGLVGGGVVSR